MLRQVIYSALILVSLSACSPHPNLSKPPVEREVVLKCVGNRYSKPSKEYFDSQCEKRRFEFEAFVYVDRPYGTVVLGPDLNLSADFACARCTSGHLQVEQRGAKVACRIMVCTYMLSHVFYRCVCVVHAGR